MAVKMTRISSLEDRLTAMQIRLDGNDNGLAIKNIRQLWEQTYPDEFFTYADVYNTFISRNSKVTEMSDLLQMYSLISILLTCFGLFGISFYAVRRRTKEIVNEEQRSKKRINLWLQLKPIFGWIIRNCHWCAAGRWLMELCCNFRKREDFPLALSSLRFYWFL
jgi:hypothetical protein